MDWHLIAGVSVLALTSSLINGVLGAGGAIVLIPLFLYGLPLLSGRRLETHAVTGLTLVAGLASAVGGGLGHRGSGRLEVRSLWRHGPFLGAGSLAGAVGSAWVSGRVLLFVFAGVTVLAAVLLVFRPREDPAARPRPLLADVFFLAIGVFGGALGVGAGFLVIPVLIHVLRVPSRSAQATGLVVLGFSVLPALAGKAATGQVPWAPVPFVFGFAVMGSWVGSLLSARLPDAGLRWGLVGVVSLMGVRVWADLLGL